MYWFMLVTNTLLSFSMFSLKIYTFSLLQGDHTVWEASLGGKKSTYIETIREL